MTSVAGYRAIVERTHGASDADPSPWESSIILDRVRLSDVLAARAMAMGDWIVQAAPWKTSDADLTEAERNFRREYPSAESYVNEWWHERHLRFAVASREIIEPVSAWEIQNREPAA